MGAEIWQHLAELGLSGLRNCGLAPRADRALHCTGLGENPEEVTWLGPGGE